MSAESRGPTEEELRLAVEQELKRLTVEDVLLQTIVSLINLGARRLGLVPDAADERDLAQGRQAIEAVRALLPVVDRAEQVSELAAIRDALAQLQLAYARGGGAQPEETGTADGQGAGGGGPRGGGQGGATGARGQEQDAGAGGSQRQPGQAPPQGQPGPAQRSGRLWVPGQ